MKFSTVKLVFKGHKTINEIYELHIKELKQTIILMDKGNNDALEQLRLELQELSAIVYNQICKNKGYKLATLKEDAYDDYCSREHPSPNSSH